MGSYRWQEVEAGVYNARNVKKYGDGKRKSGVRAQQAKYYDAGETSEARYARLKKEEKEAKGKAFLEAKDQDIDGAYANYEQRAADADAEDDAADNTEVPGEQTENVVGNPAVPPLEDQKGKGPEVSFKGWL